MALRRLTIATVALSIALWALPPSSETNAGDRSSLGPAPRDAEGLFTNWAGDLSHGGLGVRFPFFLRRMRGLFRDRPDAGARRAVVPGQQGRRAQYAAIDRRGNRIGQLHRAHRQAMAEGDTPRPHCITLRTRRTGEYGCIEVEDNGPGMDEQTQRRVFEPFFTTKSVGMGTGLGLSVSYFIVTEQHKGAIDVTSSPGEGTCFTVCLPLGGK